MFKPKTPGSATLTVKRSVRLSPEKLGVEFSVAIFDAEGEPVPECLFEIQAEEEVLVRGATDEKGEYSGQRVLLVRENTQKSISLVLEDSPVSGSSTLGEVKPEVDSSVEKEKILNGVRPISSGETFTLEAETHHVTKDIIVEEGGCLVINAGAVLEFDADAGIVCSGKLIAAGSEESKILFRKSKQPKTAGMWGKGVWKNITFMGQGVRGSVVHFCSISGGGGRALVRKKDGENQGIHLREASDYVDIMGKRGAGILFLRVNEEELGPNVDIKDENSVSLREVTVEDGGDSSIGALFSYRSSLNLASCKLIHNASGGLHAEESRLSIKGCEVSDNSNEGGITVVLSGIEVKGSLISKNSVKSGRDGAGFFIDGSNVTIDSSKIEGNHCYTGYPSRSKGGGFAVQHSRVVLNGSEVRRNHAYAGGGVHVTASDIVVNCSTIRDNTAQSVGGGLSSLDSAVQIIDSEVFGNSARNVSAIDLLRGSLRIKKTSIHDNPTKMGPLDRLIGEREWFMRIQTDDYAWIEDDGTETYLTMDGKVREKRPKNKDIPKKRAKMNFPQLYSMLSDLAQKLFALVKHR